jgi:CDP-glucose 4,6-dehydratase
MVNFWHKKKVLVTGHTGFKGSWLSLWLNKLGANVTGFSLDPITVPNVYSVLRLKKYIHDIRGDIRDHNLLKKIINTEEPEVIIHLAAQALVRTSYYDSLGTFSTNIMGTVNLLEVARTCKSVKAILIITSDKCYENQEMDYSYRETDPMGGHDPYSCSKGCSELVTSSYRRSFFNDRGVAVATARAGNVIGGGDWAAGRLIPDAFRAFSHNKVLKIRYPQAVRPWQHILEPLSGYLNLCEKMILDPILYSEGWNFAQEDKSVYSVKEVADILVQLWGSGVAWEQVGGEHLHEANLLQLDITKAKNRLNWAPKWELVTALQKTVSWYKEYYLGGENNMEKLTHEQIDEYNAIL